MRKTVYELKVREHNKQVYIDILKGMQYKENGLYSFIIRVNAGNIVDFVEMEQESFA